MEPYMIYAGVFVFLIGVIFYVASLLDKPFDVSDE